MLHKTKKVRSLKQAIQVFRWCQKTGYCSFDYETSGHHPTSGAFHITTMNISFQVGSSYVIPLDHFESKLPGRKVMKIFNRMILQNINVIKIAHNLQYELQCGWAYKLPDPQGYLFDTMIAHHLLDENKRHGLKEIGKQFFPDFNDYDKELWEGTGLNKNREGDWAKLPLKRLVSYGGVDSDLTLRFFHFFEPRLYSGGFTPLFRNMSMQVTVLLAKAQFRGVDIDQDYLAKIASKYEVLLENILSKLRNHKIVKRVWKDRMERMKLGMIKDVKKEIDLLIKLEEDNPARQRKVDNREAKIARYVRGEFSGKKELSKMQEFNPGSTDMMREILFTSKKGFQFEVEKTTIQRKGRMKIKTNNPSTDEEVLKSLQKKDKSGFIDLILENRKQSNLYNTFIKGIQIRMGDDGRIHGSFLVHGTVTGRLSSRNPNLQNIPRDTTARDIKRMYVPPPGYLILQVDYSQAELRVLAIAAGEESMMQWFREGRDIHLASACKKMGWDYDERLGFIADESHPQYEETKVERKYAKTINFGIVYGQGAPALAEGLGVSVKKAQKFIDDFNKQFPKVAKYIKSQQKLVKKQKYVKNIFGRKRRLPDINSPQYGFRLKAERDSINAPIQGAASDLTQFSSVIVSRSWVSEYLTYIITVHDSLIYLIKPEHVHKVVPELVEICATPGVEEYFGIKLEGVRMKADADIGPHWGDLHGYDPSYDYSKMKIAA